MDDDIRQLASAYLRHYDYVYASPAESKASNERRDADQSAAQEVMEVTLSGDAQRLWNLTCELVATCQTIEQLAFVAAGPVEHLMLRFGDRYLIELIDKAAAEPRWTYAIRGTYSTGLPPGASSLVRRLQRDRTELELAKLTGLA